MGVPYTRSCAMLSHSPVSCTRTSPVKELETKMHRLMNPVGSSSKVESPDTKGVDVSLYRTHILRIQEGLS